MATPRSSSTDTARMRPARPGPRGLSAAAGAAAWLAVATGPLEGAAVPPGGLDAGAGTGLGAAPGAREGVTSGVTEGICAAGDGIGTATAEPAEGAIMVGVSSGEGLDDADPDVEAAGPADPDGARLGEAAVVAGEVGAPGPVGAPAITADWVVGSL